MSGVLSDVDWCILSISCFRKLKSIGGDFEAVLGVLKYEREDGKLLTSDAAYRTASCTAKSHAVSTMTQISSLDIQWFDKEL